MADLAGAGGANIFSDGLRKAANVKVAVRCRPPLEHEIKNGATFEKLVVDSGAKGVR